MWDFYLLKMLPFALTLIKTKIHHLFDPIKNIYTSKTLNSHEKWALLTNGSKSWRFFVLINVRANGHIFRFNKPLISLRSVFWDTLYNLCLPLNIKCSDWRMRSGSVNCLLFNIHRQLIPPLDHLLPHFLMKCWAFAYQL